MAGQLYLTGLNGINAKKPAFDGRLSFNTYENNVKPSFL
jgi:hypothetical protein